MTKFTDYPLLSQLQQNLAEAGIVNPTEIQTKALAHLLNGQAMIDFHGQAQTGTGKTLAFGIPLLNTLNVSDKTTQALIVAPTRELVVQICESLKAASRGMQIFIEPIYGGVSIENQMRFLKRGAHIVVGTPGRLNDHLRRKTLKLNNLKTLVLDEADIMLDMGFKEEIDEILQFAPKNRQIWLFSATVKPGINAIKQDHMRDPITVRVAAQNVTTTNTKQYYCVVSRKVRLEALMRFIDSQPELYGVIFCQTKLLADEVAQTLNKRGYAVNALHGDLNQALRNKVIKAFKEKQFSLLVATDVAARGLDIANLTHVINYSLPEDQESYVHRIGRTGRAGKDGVAITFVAGSEVRRLQQLAHRFKAHIEPIEVPSAKSIAAVRFTKAMEQIDHLCNQKPSEHACSPQLRTLLQERSQEELLTALHNLINQTLLKGCGTAQDDQQFVVTEKSGGFERGSEQRRSGDGQEIMVTIGTDDGVSKQEMLRYVQGIKALKGQRIGRVHVIKRRTFITVAPDVAEIVRREIHGKTIRGRRVSANLS